MMIKLKDLLFERDENDTDDSGGILYYFGDKVLLCLSSGSGKWNVPKGHIMKGEDPLDGAVREFKEETQIMLNGIPKLENTYKKDNGGTFYLYVFKGEKRFVPHLDFEHVNWDYFDKGNLPEPIDDWVKEVIEND
tara:strand:+ start:68 stop:472 length:405 start_codon:yes stop_codon:yes gene_type:complete